MALRRIRSPMDPETAASLAVGDTVLVSGRIVTGRDQVHRYLASGGESPLDLTGMVLYHCGPIVVGDAGSHRVVAAGPTTSMREEPYQADVIARFKPGAVMGKGGMGERTSKALVEHGNRYPAGDAPACRGYVFPGSWNRSVHRDWCRPFWTTPVGVAPAPGNPCPGARGTVP